MIDLDSYFDCIYCINLSHRTDRLESFRKDNISVLGTNHIKIFNAINGHNIIDTSWNYSLGALGCRLSHLSVYKDAIVNNYSRILVLEDDVLLKKSLKNELKSLLSFIKDDWDLIYFGGTHFIKPQLVNKKFLKLNGTLALHAVAINCRCLKKMIIDIETDKRWIDSVIAGLHQQLKVYGFVKPLATQKKGYSDIEETYINYNISFYAKLIFKMKTILKFH